jgi:hypothetical protein
VSGAQRGRSHEWESVGEILARVLANALRAGQTRGESRPTIKRTKSRARESPKPRVIHGARAK